MEYSFRNNKGFDQLSKANLTVNLFKSEFDHGTVMFLGHVVGQGLVKPIDAKVQAVYTFPVPGSKKQLMRFLGMAGYYRKFCANFAIISEPLNRMLRKRENFEWTESCQQAFEKLKAILISLNRYGFVASKL